MSRMLENYEAALQRLILNKPTHPKLINTKYKINKATVALEAGRDPSSIRNDNPEFEALRIKIKQAEIARKTLNDNGDKRLPKQLKAAVKETKDEINDLKARYDVLLMQVNSLIVENKNLKDMLKVYRQGGKILPFQREQ
ncbi:hypothetical protein KTJ53_04875 [Acinetobacter variabilis]|uniref:hypothetical protein n=1 Tax=Acinetobacter variabilis TaxID=70346 RepID=UPI0021CEC1FB|nr:hypothetical protein [Acinetobacter variabilis]MCU4629037.1 hypothetical protein [Acinetobacter variabilis]